jgi:hypothetical protein
VGERELAFLRAALVAKRAQVARAFAAFTAGRDGPWRPPAREGLAALARGDDALAAQRLRDATRLWVARYVRPGMALPRDARAPGRPRGVRDQRPRRPKLIPGYDRATHVQLAAGLRDARGKFDWPIRALVRAVAQGVPLAHKLFPSDQVRGLLATIACRPRADRIFRRIVQQFAPPPKSRPH